MSIMTKRLTFQSPDVKSWALITQMKHCLKVKRKVVSQPKKCWLIIIASLLGVGHIQLEIQGEEMQRIPKTTNLECKKANTSISHTQEREEHRHFCISRWVSTSREQEINTKEHFQEEELNKDASQKEASKHNSYYSKYTQGVGSLAKATGAMAIVVAQKETSKPTKFVEGPRRERGSTTLKIQWKGIRYFWPQCWQEGKVAS